MNKIEQVARAICNADNGHGHEDRWKFYLPSARAAIEAMRGPTEGMVEAGYDAVGPFCDHNPSAAWHAMIDAALEGK